MTEAIVPREAAGAEYEQIGPLLLAAYGEFSASLAVPEWDRMRAGLLAFDWRGAGCQAIVVPGAERIAGAVVYFAPGRADPALFAPGWAAMRLLAVCPAARGRGIGGILIEDCLSRARRDGATMLALHTGAMMADARSLYERRGFRIVRELAPRFGVRYWLYARDLA